MSQLTNDENKANAHLVHVINKDVNRVVDSSMITTNKHDTYTQQSVIRHGNS